MTTSRIKDLTSTETLASDDYLVVDSATEGTRAVPTQLVKPSFYDTSYSSTVSIDTRGVYYTGFTITPKNASDITNANLSKIKAYAVSDSTPYPLRIVMVYKSSTTFGIYVKSHYGSPQNTSTEYISSIVHFITPFEVDSISVIM